jgi:hypothetical protein
MECLVCFFVATAQGDPRVDRQMQLLASTHSPLTNRDRIPKGFEHSARQPRFVSLYRAHAAGLFSVHSIPLVARDMAVLSQCPKGTQNVYKVSCTPFEKKNPVPIGTGLSFCLAGHSNAVKQSPTPRREPSSARRTAGDPDGDHTIVEG